MNKSEFGEWAVSKYRTDEIVSLCLTMLRTVNKGVAEAIAQQNVALAAEQKGNLNQTIEVLDKLKTKLTGHNPSIGI